MMEAGEMDNAAVSEKNVGESAIDLEAGIARSKRNE
jgi:hypothetical protein